MTGLPEGFEPLDSCTCEWCEAWRKKEKSETRRKEKIDPNGIYTVFSADGDATMCVARSLSVPGCVYVRLGNGDNYAYFAYADARRLARVLKAMSK